MKTIILSLLLGALSGVAYADENPVSTATYGGVSISTSAPTRVDNISTAGASRVLTSRNHVRLSNPASNPILFCGYDAHVSTIQANANFGESIPADKVLVLDISAALQYWCQSAPAASAPRISVVQTALKSWWGN